MNAFEATRQQYNEAYSGAGYYWSKSPSSICFEILRRMPPTRPLKVLDIGCGEGRNAVFLARNGYEVHAFDISENGIGKTKALAAEAGVVVHAFTADLTTYRLEDEYDILFSTGVLHCLPPVIREEWFHHYKQHTMRGGLHVFSVFVEKPFIPPSPDADPNGSPWKSGELLAKYHDWLVEWSAEEVFDCNSSGVPHRHCVNRIIARRIES
jgi:tellurite methyltransferase